MASSASLKDLSKALHAFVTHPTLPLPPDLIETINAYLRRHAKYDDAASDRLQDELLLIFHNHVQAHFDASGPWIAILRRLLPALRTPSRVLVWFDAFKGILDRPDLDKLVVDETVIALMELVTFTDDYQVASGADSATNPVIDRLFNVWLNRFCPTSLPPCAPSEGNESLVRQTLVNFGKKKPREFFTSMDSLFVRKQHRKSILRFLCHFIQSQPPHLYQILQTSIFSNLLSCLQHDTSTTVVSLALTSLVMLLPHMPSSLVPHLPTLFDIYARLLFWDCLRTALVDRPLPEVDPPTSWHLCSYDPDVDDFPIAHLADYYTILYGLYPLNFMDFIRKPQRYLRQSSMSGMMEIDIQPTEIRNRSEAFRRRHLLHPNFYTLTIESEKTDLGRWIKSEPAEVVVECLGLCLPTEAPRQSDSSDPQIKSILTNDSAPLETPPQKSTPTCVQDMIHSNRIIKSELQRAAAANDEPDSPPAADSSMTQTSHLWRKMLLLENDLCFERYVKQQHMAHIGELRRRLLAEAATEAETQNLIFTNRLLKNRFEEAKKAEMQLRRESEKSRALVKKRESDLANRLKYSRDESKQSSAHLDALGRQLDESRREIDRLRKLVSDAEVKELSWKQSMQSIEIQGNEVDRLRTQVEELTKSERDHQSRELKRKEAVSELHEAEARVGVLEVKLAAQEDGARRTARLLQSQVADLESQLADAQQEEHFRLATGTHPDVEGVLAASRAKQAELEKQYDLLTRKYTALQSSLLDMRSEAAADSKKRPTTPTNEELKEEERVGSPVDEGAFSPGQPPGRQTTRRPSRTADGQRGTASPAPAVGLTGRARKETRDKAKEEVEESAVGKPKKEKKLSGLRGIRGFM